ncbi:uncharacterized protein BO72DRAFT_156472 [Aspergillus fijiensis CBS 313.89]|uniref:Uncharacterized protein n=1 Tax=Aspergillus fijiensis CBS 313.89 TaxID=1448319 RepID=A0A8G1RPH6_9EURO|nr:uncharacterized protein BO72DRAFT_156472 [Aspergillus fijiensis CBS 313.89]RAK75938.1 hypothetical protein BO72DRAFT_156472 [Aspergillus fijiensis CBS 313.89]
MPVRTGYRHAAWFPGILIACCTGARLSILFLRLEGHKLCGDRGFPALVGSGVGLLALCEDSGVPLCQCVHHSRLFSMGISQGRIPVMPVTGPLCGAALTW